MLAETNEFDSLHDIGYLIRRQRHTDSRLSIPVIEYLLKAEPVLISSATRTRLVISGEIILFLGCASLLLKASLLNVTFLPLYFVKYGVICNVVNMVSMSPLSLN